MVDAGSCDIAASCLCGGETVHVGNLPADAVLEAVVTTALNAQVTAVFGATSFQVGDRICVNQSVVGATILVPVQSAGDAAQVVPPPPDGGTCVPDYAYTVLLDDAGRPLSCNDGDEGSIPLSEDAAVSALRAGSCSAALAAMDGRWGESLCPASSGCHVAGVGGGGAVLLLLVLAALRIPRRIRREGKSGCRRDSSRGR